MELPKDEFGTLEELGKASRASDPELRRIGWTEDRDRDLGLKILKKNPHLKISPQNLGDYDPRRQLDQAAENFFPEMADNIEGFAKAFWSPINTGIGMIGAVDRAAETQVAPKVRGASNFILKLLGGLPMDRTRKAEFPHIGPGNRPLGDSTTPEVKDALDKAGNQYINDTFTLEGFQENAPRWLSNLPTPVGALKKGPKFVRAAGHALEVADPSVAPFKIGGALAKQPFKLPIKAGRFVAEGLNDKVAKPIAAMVIPFLDDMKSPDVDLWVEIVSSISGVTTGKGQQFMQELFQRAGTKVKTLENWATSSVGPGAKGFIDGDNSFESVVRKIRKMDRKDSDDFLIQTGLQYADEFKHHMDIAFAQAKGELPLKDLIEIDMPMRRSAARSLRRNFGVSVSGMEEKFLQANRHFGQQTVQVPTGQTKLTFPDFGDKPGQVSAISSQGIGRSQVERIYGAFFDSRQAHSVGDLWDFRRSIDDALSVATSETSAEARKALGDLRKTISDKLLGQVPGFAETMAEWEAKTIMLERMDVELGIKPGHLTKDGTVRGLSRENILEKLLGTMDDTAGEALPRQTLERLQEAVGDERLIPIILGVGSNDLSGKGLTIRSQLADIGRSVVALSIFIGGPKVLLSLPATAIFSPRMMSDAMLRLGMKNRDGTLNIKGALDAVGTKSNGDLRFAKSRQFIRRMADMQEKAQKLNDSSGGELAKTLKREGVTLGQLFQRLQIETGVDVDTSQIGSAPSQGSTLGILGNINRRER
tara:strand:+ start:1149 stop:3434 length:2286 start_codon:yes stop_codon:yes gene_type:complete